MGCQSLVYIGDDLTFSICTHDPETSILSDADAPPTYRVYEGTTGTALLNGTMSKLDDALTSGFYAALIACTTANGFEHGKSYTVYIEATVAGNTGGIPYSFMASDPVPAVNVTQVKGAIPANLDASGNVLVKLADAVVHGGFSAEMNLKKFHAETDDIGGIAFKLAGTNSSGGRAISLTGGWKAIEMSGASDLVIGGLNEDALQNVADAGLLAPTAGTPAADSMFDYLQSIEVLAGAGVSGGGEHTSTPDHWGGGTGETVAFSDHWDIITAISPNTAGGNNPPGDFGAVRLHLTSPYVAGSPIGSAILNLGLQGADGNFALKIELLAAPASLSGTTYAERSWGTETVLVTGTNYDLEVHDIDVTPLVTELLAAVPSGTSISYLVFGVSPTGGNSPSVTFSDGNTIFPSVTLTEAFVLSGLTKQDVADAVLDEAKGAHTGHIASIPTTAEMIALLAGADDAVLAAIGALNDLDATGAQAAAAAALAAYGVALEATSQDILAILSGGGGIPFEYTVYSSVDGVTPLVGVRVRVTTDDAGLNFVSENYTDVFGKIVFHLNAGTYRFWRYRELTSFVNPDLEIVS